MKHSKRVLAAVLAGVMTASMLPMSALAAEEIALSEGSVAEVSSNDPVAVDGYYYAIVNMQNADFYYGELNNVKASESTKVGTEDKVATYRAEGMYDTVTSATQKKSTRYATSWYETDVANNETSGEATGTNLYGIKDVQIKVPVAVYDAIMAAKAEDGSTLAIVKDYLKNASYSSTAFTTEYKQLNADGTFTAMITTEGEKEVESDVTVSTSSAWGNYQIDLGSNISEEATTDNLYGIILTDKDGNNYGMLHSDNTWLRTNEFSWAVNSEFQEPHGNHIPYQRTDGLKDGNTITQIKYLLKDTADIVVKTNSKLKNVSAVANATASATSKYTTANGTEVQIKLDGVPSDANYTVGKIVKGGRRGVTIDPSQYSYNASTGVLKLSADCAIGTDYVVTMVSDGYQDLKISSGVAVTPQLIDGYFYATVNMSNADFYYGELNNVKEDSTVNTESDKVASYREEGMYDTVTSATSRKSTRYATAWYETNVQNNEESRTKTETNDKGETVTTYTNTNLYGIKDVQVKIPAAVYDAYVSGKFTEGSTAAQVQNYLNGATYSTTAFTTEYKVLNGDGTFTKMVSNEGEQKVETTVELRTDTAWGDYQLNLGDNISELATTDNLYGIIVTDKNGNNYGMLHSDNAWLRTNEFSWAVDDVFVEPHGNHNPYLRTDGLKNGNTITKVTYLLKDAADVVVETNTFIKNRVGATAKVSDVNTTDENTTAKITMENIPADANYKITAVERWRDTVDSSLYSFDKTTGVLTLSKDCPADGYYITMQDEKYNDIEVELEVASRIYAPNTVKKAKGSKAFKLNATTNAEGGVLKYSSSNTKIAKVDENGKVTVSKKRVGKAVITIAAEVTETDWDGNTTTTTVATKKVTVKVTPKTSRVTSVKSTKKGRATVKVAKVAGAKYQIQYSNSKSKIASGKKVATSSTTKTLKSLKRGKRVYVRVRAYQKANGATYYSNWSAVKSVKVKK